MGAKGKYFFGSLFLFAAAFTAEAQQERMSVSEYIATFKYAAMEEMATFKIPASITLGQGILESSSGNSRLSKEGNNHFGIKCKKGWTGKTISEDDDALGECFRAYDNPFESYRDHSLFLVGGNRYAPLFSLAPTDYSRWATGLKDAGYATNQAYDKILTGIIVKYRLTMYDSLVLYGDGYFVNKDSQNTTMENGVPRVTVKPGEQTEGIAKRFKLESWQIYKYNDLPKDASINPGDILYLKPKKKKACIPTHKVEYGENVYAISQKYGVKLKQVYKMNRLKPGQQVTPGEVINLQKKRGSTPKVLFDESNPNAENGLAISKDSSKDENGTINKGTHIVHPGETLYFIAKKYNIKVGELVSWNNLESNTLLIGQLLVVDKGVVHNSQDTLTREGITKIVAMKTYNPLYHVVMKGQTLYGIAAIYHMTLEELKQLNHLTTDVVGIGTKLLIQLKPEVEKVETYDENGYYTVKEGESAYSIAQKFNISISQLLEWNNMKDYTLFAGQKLRIILK